MTVPADWLEILDPMCHAMGAIFTMANLPWSSLPATCAAPAMTFYRHPPVPAVHTSHQRTESHTSTRCRCLPDEPGAASWCELDQAVFGRKLPILVAGEAFCASSGHGMSPL